MLRTPALVQAALQLDLLLQFGDLGGNLADIHGERGRRYSRERRYSRSRRDRRRGYSRSRSRRRDRSRDRTRGGGYGRRSYRHRPRLGDDFKNKRAPDGRPYCIDFKLGRCNRSDCRYYHKEKELCLDFQRGKCSYGDRCKFAHPDGSSKSSRT
eukprot:UN14552